MRQNAELLINTASRRARSRKQQVLRALEAHGFNITSVHEVNRSAPLTTVLERVRKRPPKLLVIAGGDGTFSTVMNFLAELSLEIGLIPLGTTNNFARSLNIPFGIEEAVTIIAHSKTRQVDLGNLNGRYFTNVAGIGLTARIADNVLQRHKKRYGRLAYLFEGINQLFRSQPFTVTLSDPDNKFVFSLVTWQVLIANGRYHAGREIAADTKVDNGELVIFTLGGSSRISLMWHVLDFYFKRRRHIATEMYFTARNIEIRTDRSQSVELDGEVVWANNTHLTVTTEPRAVRVRVAA